MDTKTKELLVRIQAWMDDHECPCRFADPDNYRDDAAAETCGKFELQNDIEDAIEGKA